MNRARQFATDRLRDRDLPPDAASVDRIASGVTKSIRTHYDPAKARPRAKSGRADKAIRDRNILEHYVKSGGDLSIRQLSTQLGLSTSVVQRALAAHGVSPKRDAQISVLSEDARSAALYVDTLLRRDGRRLIDKVDLGHCILPGVEASLDFRLHEVAQELGAARIGVQLHETALESFRSGSVWVVLNKGRRRSALELSIWAEACEKKRLTQQNPLRPNQRYYVAIGHGGLLRIAEHRDLAAVFCIMSGSHDLTHWRNFIEASLSICPGDEQHPGRAVRDPGALMTVTNCALKLANAEPLEELQRAANWILDREDSETARWLFTLAEGLREMGGYDWQGLCYWLEETQYLERVEAGLLPPRNTRNANAVVEELARYGGDLDGLFVLEQLDSAATGLPIDAGGVLEDILSHQPRPPDSNAWTMDEDEDEDEDEREDEEEYEDPDGYIYPLPEDEDTAEEL